MTKTKRAFLASTLSLLLCVSMLIGSTFAWFTDTATTGVNTIQAGTLDIAFMMKKGDNWVSAEGEILNFTNKEGASEILWEPGTTFTLPTLKLVNNGNLALKFYMVVNGVYGDLALADVLDVMIAVDNNTAVYAGTLAQFMADPDGAAHGIILPEDSAQSPLSPDTTIGESAEYTISLHMQENAGNEYQGKSLSGMTFTAFASQYTYENDSYNDQYDVSATLPAIVINTELAATVESDKETVIQSSDTASTPVSATIPANAIATQDVAEIALKVSTAKTAEDSATYNIDFVVSSADETTETEVTFNQAVTVRLNIGKGLSNVQVTHNNNEHFSSVGSATNLYDKTFYYDAATGVLSVCSSSFSPYTVTFAKASAQQRNNIETLVAQGYSKVENYDQLKTAITAGKNVVLADDITSNGVSNELSIPSGQKVTIDLNGYTVTHTADSGNFIHVNGDAALTVNDSALIGSMIVNVSNGFSSMIWNEGTTVINGGNLVLNCTGKAWGYVVDNRANAWSTDYQTPATLTVNGGVLNAGGEEVVRVAYNSSENYEAKNSSFTMTGGKLIGYSGIFVQQLDYKFDELTVTVQGGTLETSNYIFRIYSGIGYNGTGYTYNGNLSGAVNKITISENVTLSGTGASGYYVRTPDATNSITVPGNFTVTKK